MTTKTALGDVGTAVTVQASFVTARATGWLALVLAGSVLGGCAARPAQCPCAAQEPQVAELEEPSAPQSSPAAEAPRAKLETWRDGVAKQRIVDFVTRVTTANSTDFVPPSERVAVFDNDGTLWSEQPIYVQFAFALDRVKTLAPAHPEWKKKQPFKAVLEGNLAAALASGDQGLIELMTATHAGMPPDEFEKVVLDWLKTARHPQYNRPYTELTYAPMVELLHYLGEHDFRVFIVSGGGVAFMRPWVEAAYGIPRERVVGSRLELGWQKEGGLTILPKLEFVDDGPGKPVGIEHAIGRRPIFAAGNSDGDLQMLEYTAAGVGPRFALLVHHTDAERETAYDRKSPIGKLDLALDRATAAGWAVVDMKNDWARVFAE